MAVLRSPYAHARIRRVDTSKAEGHPGVVAVWSGREIVDRCAAQHPLHGATDGMNVRARWSGVSEVGNYAGEPVAAVVATTRGTAKDVLDLIEVDYEPLPVVVGIEEAEREGSPLVHEDLGTNVCFHVPGEAGDIDEAEREGSPLVHEDLGTNVCFHVPGEAGDIDEAFREADGVVSLRLFMPRIVPSPMEARAVVASFERGAGTLTVWDTSQGTPQ